MDEQRKREVAAAYRQFTTGAMNQASAYRTGYGLTQEECDDLILRARSYSGGMGVMTHHVDAAFDEQQRQKQAARERRSRENAIRVRKVHAEFAKNWQPSVDADGNYCVVPK